MVGIALVTGATKGIGLEVVQQLAKRGWQVFLTGRSPDAVKQIAIPLGASVIPVTLDVTDEDSIAAAVKGVSQKVDHLDVLINNAGILDEDDGSIFDLPAERLRRMFETNAVAVLPWRPKPFSRCSVRAGPPASSMSRAGPASSPTWRPGLRPIAFRRLPSMA